MLTMLYNNVLIGNDMKKLDLSRGPLIDMDKCVVEAGGNRFDLVLIAAARAREIKRQHSSSDKREHVHSIITALSEIEAGTVDSIKYLGKVK
jgi:DNA-directed RNA polymerase omega subunit